MITKKQIGLKAIMSQLKADLIGKDSHRGVTLTYSWLANQFGHFSLGFIPTLIVYRVLKKCFCIDNALISGITIATLWLLFEIYNFLGPLLFKRRSGSKILYLPSGSKYVFEPQWGNIAFDTLTDVGYFCLGAFTASWFLDGNTLSLYLVGLVAILLLYPSLFWFSTKMYQNYAYYPYQFRLSQWENEIEDDDKEKVYDFMNSEANGKHLLIFGTKNSGKTSLGVGIANELSMMHKVCTYTSAIKLYSMFFDVFGIDRPKEIWTWRETSVLVIDDINPGDPIEEELTTPDDFLRYVDCLEPTPNLQNRALIRDKNVIWILGNENVSLFNEWETMLINLGIGPQNIKSIRL